MYPYHIVRPEMNHDNIRLRLLKPTGKLSVLSKVGRKYPSMAFVVAVVWESTALSWQRADKLYALCQPGRL
jgi:hypothetical protein